MCYAIPGRIVSLNGKKAVVDYFGERRTVRADFTDLTVGDYVYAQGGFVVDKIDASDALPILEQWKDTFFQLALRDAELARTTDKRHEGEFAQILSQAEDGSSLSHEQIARLLNANLAEQGLLFGAANRLRHAHLKNACCVHGIIEFSNICINDCLYCGIRHSNEKLSRYRLSVDEIVDIAVHAVKKHGFRALVLQSGEDIAYSTDDFVNIIQNIKKQCGVLLFMSVGCRDLECYTRMYHAGARGVLLRFETSNLSLYSRMHKGAKSDFSARLELVRHAKKSGYLIATGSIIGLPGQTEIDLANDILLAKSLGADMYSFGPLIPHPDTPLNEIKPVDVRMVLKMIATSRLVDPDATILVTSALETLDRQGRRSGLLSGANSLMINITPSRQRALYSIYPRRTDSLTVEENIDSTIELLHELGRAPTDLGR